MLTSIDLENYRAFKLFRLAGLSRVNLLVGKNNCGKTSVLEAIQFVASGGDPDVLMRIALQRGEVTCREVGDERYARDTLPVLSHFFYGHEFRPGAWFTVRTSDGLGEIRVRVADPSDIEQLEATDRQEVLFKQATFLEEDSALRAALRAALLVVFERPSRPNSEKQQAFLATEEGAVSLDAVRRYHRLGRSEREISASVQFISPDSLEPRSMNGMWDKVITEGRESEVIDAMRILEPRLTGIFFLSGEMTYRGGGRAGVLAAFQHTPRRDPLGTHGEGMRRLLALSISLIRAEHGVLLVDEIDTGLHYSILAAMWRLVIEAAKRADVQVFATTHSLDCVKGLAWVCDNHPELRPEVSLQKIDCDLEEAVALDAEHIVLAVDQGMEVR